jgi:hypothetical protein
MTLIFNTRTIVLNRHLLTGYERKENLIVDINHYHYSMYQILSDNLTELKDFYFFYSVKE